jgi:hypothetical protein
VNQGPGPETQEEGPEEDEAAAPKHVKGCLSQDFFQQDAEAMFHGLRSFAPISN